MYMRYLPGGKGRWAGKEGREREGRRGRGEGGEEGEKREGGKLVYLGTM